MPDLVIGQLAIPWGGQSPRSRRTSLQGAQVASIRAGSQCARLLVAYLQYGASSDLQMAERLGLPESRISARRSALIKRHQVTWAGDTDGPHGAQNALWSLTGYGREVAKTLAQTL